MLVNIINRIDTLLRWPYQIIEESFDLGTLVTTLPAVL